MFNQFTEKKLRGRFKRHGAQAWIPNQHPNGVVTLGCANVHKEAAIPL